MASASPALGPKDLAAELHRLEEFPQALQRRVKGVSWMLWGLVLAGIFVTYDYAGLAMRVYGGQMWIFLLLWIPWVLLGFVASLALWKSNGLRPNAAKGIQRTAVTFLVFALLAFLLFLAYHYSGIWRSSPLVGPSVMLTMVGLAALVVGLTGLTCSDRTDRLLWTAGGLVLLAIVVIGTLTIGHDMELALRVFGALGPLATAVVYFGNGLYLTLRG